VLSGLEPQRHRTGAVDLETLDDAVDGWIVGDHQVSMS
jgi:hypothetical protein